MNESAHLINPLWSQMVVQEGQERPLHAKGSNNYWKKSILAFVTIGLVLTVVGVPIYTLATTAASSAIPLDFSAGSTPMGTVSLNVGATGDLIDYELTHWGAKPSVALLADIITDAFSDVGLEAAFYFVLGGVGIEDAAGAILAAGLFSDSAIATALLAFLSSPVGWGVLIFIGSVIVGF